MAPIQAVLFANYMSNFQFVYDMHLFVSRASFWALMFFFLALGGGLVMLLMSWQLTRSSHVSLLFPLFPFCMLVYFPRSQAPTTVQNISEMSSPKTSPSSTSLRIHPVTSPPDSAPTQWRSRSSLEHRRAWSSVLSSLLSPPVP